MRISKLMIFFWVTFIASIVILILSFGLILYVGGLLFLGMFFLHSYVGINLNKMEAKEHFVLISAINILIFSLIRIDGAHVISHNGLSSLLDLVDINWGYNSAYKNLFLGFSIILLIFQLLLDLALINSIKENETSSNLKK